MITKSRPEQGDGMGKMEYGARASGFQDARPSSVGGFAQEIVEAQVPAVEEQVRLAPLRLGLSAGGHGDCRHSHRGASGRSHQTVAAAHRGSARWVAHDVVASRRVIASRTESTIFT